MNFIFPWGNKSWFFNKKFFKQQIPKSIFVLVTHHYETRPPCACRSSDNEQSFICFLAALAKDWKQAQEIDQARLVNALCSVDEFGWENGTVGPVLDAAVA